MLQIMVSQFNAWSVERNEIEFQPKTIDFDAMLNVWDKSGEKGAAERDEDILEGMGKMHKSGNCDVGSNTITLNYSINYWYRSGDMKYFL